MNLPVSFRFLSSDEIMRKCLKTSESGHESINCFEPNSYARQCTPLPCSRAPTR
jgi:hypothetical protein